MALRMENRKKLGKAASMLASGATHAEVAEACGVTTNSIQNWKKAGYLDKPKPRKKRAKIRHETMEVPLTPESGTFSITGSASEIAKFLKAVSQ